MVENFRNTKKLPAGINDILVNRFGSSEEAKMIKRKNCSADFPSNWKTDSCVFQVVSMDDSTKTITNESLRGKYYLMDFLGVEKRSKRPRNAATAGSIRKV